MGKKLKNTIPGEWEIGNCWLKTSEKLVNLSESLLEVNIEQNIENPFELGVFLIMNDAGVDSLLPLVNGTEMGFEYIINGISYKRIFKLIELEYVSESEKSKALRLIGITSEFYQASMEKNSIAYENMAPDKILKMNGIRNLFVNDKTSEKTWVIPHNYNRIKFVSNILFTLQSDIPRLKKRLLKTKEGYSICDPLSFTQNFKEFYGLNPQKEITLQYKNEKLKRKNESQQLGDDIPIQQFLSVDNYQIKSGRSLIKSINSKEHSYFIEKYDPMRKMYSTYKHEQRKNTIYDSVLYLKEDEERTSARHYFTDSSSTEINEAIKNAGLTNEFSLNKKGYSTQNSLLIQMNSSALIEVGLYYQIEIGADIPGEMNEYIDPVFSGLKLCTQVKHIFIPDQIARAELTLSSEGGIPTKKYHKLANLSKK